MESEGAGLVEVRQEIDRLRAEMTDIGATNDMCQACQWLVPTVAMVLVWAPPPRGQAILTLPVNF